MKYLDSSIKPNPLQDKEEIERLLDMVQLGWRKMVIRHRFLPHMIVSNTVINNHNGVMENRPDIEILGVDNLYIIGDWIGPDGMLADTIFASAKAVALKILNEKAGIKIHTA